VPTTFDNNEIIGRNNNNSTNISKLIIQPNVSKTGLNLASIPNPPLLFV